VHFEMTEKAGEVFAKATAANIGRKLAIILDRQVLSAPTIRSAIPGGKVMISGRFTVAEATTLAVLLSTSPLPAPVIIESERALMR
jgi:SecD/SecF fusion protein